MVNRGDWTKSRDIIELRKGYNANTEHLWSQKIPFSAQNDTKFQFYKNT